MSGVGVRAKREKGGGGRRGEKNRFHVLKFYSHLKVALDVVYESGTINLTNKEAQ